MPTFDGTSASETINGSESADLIRGNGGNDFLNGLGGDDTIEGGPNIDTIDGGTGADLMVGGGGNDVYYVDNAGDVVRDYIVSGNDGGNNDRIYTTISYTLGQATGEYVEWLIARDDTSTTPLMLIGNRMNNEIRGNAGNNILGGGDTGTDNLIGLGGDDAYYAKLGDTITEQSNGGYDTIFMSLARGLNQPYDIPSNVERFINTSTTGGAYIRGNGLANEIHGTDFADALSGGFFDDALDTLIGGNGDDLYYILHFPNGSRISSINDNIVEYAGGGNDRVEIDDSFTLPDNVEQLTGRGTLIGNDLNNVIIGTGIDVIDGRAGADRMEGRDGGDAYFVDNVGDLVIETAFQGRDTVFVDGIDYVLPDNVEVGAAAKVGGVSGFNLTGNGLDNEISGNDGANVLDGKLGLDTLIGYGGADVFAFTTRVDGDNADKFLGFEVGIDKIALDDAVFSGLTAGALPDGAFRIGRFAIDADDRILYEADTGNLFFDPDGNGPLAAQYFASMHDGLSLSASDFIVI